MFEVEKKFVLNEKDILRIMKDAEFLSERIFVDEYFDNDQFSLSSQDIWLQKRAGVFQLKIPMHAATGKTFDQYDEIEGEMAIREIFAIPIVKGFVQDIADLGHVCFCKLTTRRRKYKKGDFIIDLDEVESDGWKYLIGEIELMADDRTKIPEVSKRIEEFAKENNLEIAPVRGKVYEFIKQYRPDHFSVLVEAGIVDVG